LCDPKVVQEAESILNQADQAAGNADAEITARIQFLRDGLRHLSLTRDVIALAYGNKGSLDERKKALAQKGQELHALQDELSPRHVVWGHVVRGTMRNRNVAPEGKSSKALSLD